MGEYQHLAVFPLREDHLLRKDSDRGARGNSVSMCSKLWGRLPTEIMERVLLFLPAEIQRRFQLVCRAWRLRLTSPGFWEDSTSQALAYHRLCLVWECPELLAKADRPLLVDLSFIPAKFKIPFGWYDERHSHFCVYSSNFSLVWQRVCDGKLWLCLVNLDKRTCTTVLPPLSLHQPPFPEHELEVRCIGEVVLEPEGLFFQLAVILEGYNRILHVAKYSSRFGMWTICRLDWSLEPIGQIDESRRCYCDFLLYKDSRAFILYRRVKESDKYGRKYWALACFCTQDGSRLAKGYLGGGTFSDGDMCVAHSRGVYLIRHYDRGIEPSVCILSWTIPFNDNYGAADEQAPDNDENVDEQVPGTDEDADEQVPGNDEDADEQVPGNGEDADDEHWQVRYMDQVSVLTAKYLDSEMSGDNIDLVNTQMVDNTILMFFVRYLDVEMNELPVLPRVLGYNVKEKSWSRLVY